VVGLLTLWLVSCSSSTQIGGTGAAGTTATAGTTGGAGTVGSAGTTGAAGTTANAGSNGTAGTNAAAGRGGAAGTMARGGNAGGAAGGGGAAGAASCPATANATPGEMTRSITVGSMTRTFVRHVPPGYTGTTPVPVVIDFHPLGGTGASWKGSTGWSALADRQGFIMIWPDGVSSSWNAGRCCRTALEQNIDDVAFTRAIIATLSREACIDVKRVYATGCSNGGGMAFKVACDAADVIAAVAPVDFDCVTSAAASDRTCGTTCAPSRPISEIQFRGTNDTAVPYEGGLRSGGTTTFPGAQQTFMSFGAINMCTGAPQPLPNHSACQAYPMCGADVDTVLCTVQNGTHCGSYQSFGIVNIAWEVFQKHALP
jgi:polyhydroxybutyrate depolymerase